MKHRIFLDLIAISISALAFFSCTNPDSVEQFIKSDKAVGGTYSFGLEMKDSLCTYDVFFYTRVESEKSGSLCLDVCWWSPSGKTFSETVYMNSGNFRGMKECYRSGLRPLETGTWKLEIKPVDPPVEMRGMGVICKRNGSR